MSSVDPNALPTGPEGNGDAFAGLDLATARQMLDDAESEAPQVDVDQVVANLEQAALEYRQGANSRKFLKDFLDGAGTVFGLIKALS